MSNETEFLIASKSKDKMNEYQLNTEAGTAVNSQGEMFTNERVRNPLIKPELDAIAQSKDEHVGQDVHETVHTDQSRIKLQPNQKMVRNLHVTHDLLEAMETFTLMDACEYKQGAYGRAPSLEPMQCICEYVAGIAKP